MGNTYYIKFNKKSMPVVFTRRARENAALNFVDNILFVLETVESLIEDKKVVIRNPAYDYDLTVLVSSETEEIVVLNFEDIIEERRADIVFELSLIA